MKICNNCGWYNQDSAVSCVKCQDTSFKQMAEAVVEEQPISRPVETTGMATVAFNAESPVISKKSSEQKKFAATVLDAEAYMHRDKEQSCRECRYPIVGNVDYCPNCGAAVCGSTASGQVPVAADENKPVARNLKATVRDVSECLETKSEMFRLVPMDSPDGQSYQMTVGDVVTIGGCRYRFQKS